MKEDLEVVRELLLAIFSDKDPKGFEVGTVAKVKKNTDGIDRFSYTIANQLTDQERYYFELLQERGLIRFTNGEARVHLTAKGQDFCHAVGDQEVWDHIKGNYLGSPFNLEGIISACESWKMIIRAVSRSDEKDWG